MNKVKLNVSFNGRICGAIGELHNITDTIELPESFTTDEIQLKLYAKYEHITRLKINVDSESQPRPPRFKHLSISALIAKINRAKDFKWDDEGAELDRRIKNSNGKLSYYMDYNKLKLKVIK